MDRLTLCLTELHLLILLPLLRRPHNIATPSICATLFSTKNAAKVTIRMKEDLTILLSVWGSCFFSLFNSRWTNEKILCDCGHDFSHFCLPFTAAIFWKCFFVDEVQLLPSGSIVFAPVFEQSLGIEWRLFWIGKECLSQIREDILYVGINTSMITVDHHNFSSFDRAECDIRELKQTRRRRKRERHLKM